jgi:hypothetical protein
MRRLTALASLALVVLTLATVSAAAKKFGTPLTLKETTKVSAILASPSQFDGKRVQVQGPVVGVCEMRGCWIAIGSDKEFGELRFKVDDGVIVFPMSIKGMNATVEGVVSVQTLDAKTQIEQGQHMAKEEGKAFDPASVKGPKTVVQLKGEAAEVY